MKCLRRVVLEYADVFDALCWNIDRQVKGWEGYDSRMAITVKRDEKVPVDSSKEEDKRVLGLIQRSTQLAHLDVIKECLQEGDGEGAVSRIPFLHLDYGVEEAEYRAVLQDLLKGITSKREGYGLLACCTTKIAINLRRSLASNCRHLIQMIEMHFDEELSARHKGGDSTKLVTKGNRGKSASEKLTEGLVKFSARVSIHVEVVKSFNDSDGPQWKHSLLGNPNDPETFRRRCEIAETLVEKNFDLAFQVIYEFNLPAVDIYAGVAALLAERKKGSQLTEFFRNIKRTIDDDEWDQVLGAAINVYTNKHKERPDRIIDVLTSIHRKVLVCVVCGRLKSAFQIASRSGSMADV